MFMFQADCLDTCTREEWEKSFSVSLAAAYEGKAKVPGACGLLIYFTRRAGKTAGSMGRNRAIRSMQWGCGMVMAHNISKVAGAVYREVEKAIEFRGLPLIDYYMDLGATAICQGG